MFNPRSDEGMFLGYSLKRKAYKCCNYRNKTILESKNIRIDEKFGTKEMMVDYNLDEEEDNFGIVIHNVEVFFETSNDLLNDVLAIDQRREKRSKTRDEIRVQMSNPTPIWFQ